MLLADVLPETLPVSQDASLDFGWLFFKVVVVMVVVCLAAFAVIKYLLPRASFVRRMGESQIEIVERFGLEPKKNLYILKIGKKNILVGTADNFISSLAEFEEKELSSDASKES